MVSVVRQVQDFYAAGAREGFLCSAVIDCAAARVDFVTAGSSSFAGGRGNYAVTAVTPPELTGCVHDAVGIGSDIYVLAASFYCYLTSENLFRGNTAQDLISQILHVCPKSLSEQIYEFPQNLSRIIDKSLRKNSRDRYQTLEGLLFDLDSLQNDLEKLVSPDFLLGVRDPSRELNQVPRLVGRESETATFAEFLDQTSSAEEECLILISGPSGVGKSQLSQIYAQMAAAKNWQTCYVKFQDGEGQSSLRRVMRHLEDFLDDLGSLPAPMRAQWIEHVHGHLQGVLPVIAARIPVVHKFFPWTESFVQSPLTDGNLEEVFFDGLSKLCSLLHTSDKKGVVWIFDDVQWADKNGFEIISRIVRLSQNNPLLSNNNSFHNHLVLCLYRTKDMPMNEENSGHRRTRAHHLEHEGVQRYLLPYLSPNCHVALSPLTKEESAELALELLGTSTKNDMELCSYCAEMCFGNPFSIREFLIAALASGVYFLDQNQQWQINKARLRNFRLSYGSVSLLKQRIKKCPPEMWYFLGLLNCCLVESNKTLMKAAWVELALADVDAFDVTLNLARLNHFIVTEDDRVFFSHDMVKESLSDLLPEDFHRRAHDAMAKVFITKAGDDSGPLEAESIVACGSHLVLGSCDPLLISRSISILLKAGRLALQVFSYEKAERFAVFVSERSFHEDALNDRENYFLAQELLADIYAHTERISEAILIYKDIVSQSESTTISAYARAQIYAKMCRCELGLFRYSESLRSGIEGLRELGYRYHTGIGGLIFALFFIPEFLLRYLVFRFVGFRISKDFSVHESAILELMNSVQVAAYYSRSVVAVANHLLNPLTRSLFQRQDSRLSAIHLFYWSIALISFGAHKMARACYQRSLDYFQKHPDPAVEGQILFSLGYLIEFHRGQIAEAQRLQELAFAKLQAVGESFYRINSMQALILLGVFGSQNAAAQRAAVDLEALWKSIHFAPTYLGVLSHMAYAQGQIAVARAHAARAARAAREIIRQGHLAIDCLYAFVSYGDTLLKLGKVWQAERYLTVCLWLALRSMNRVMYPNYGIVLLAKARLIQKKRLSAVLPILYSWFNVFATMPVLLSQTLFITGHWFWLWGFHGWALSFFQKCLAHARVNKRAQVEADLALEIACVIKEKYPDYSFGIVEKSLCYFLESSQTKNATICEELLQSIRQHSWGQTLPSLQKVKNESFPDSHLVQKKHERKEQDLTKLVDLHVLLKDCRNNKETAHALLGFFQEVAPYGFGYVAHFSEGKWDFWAQFSSNKEVYKSPADLLESWQLPAFRTAALLNPPLCETFSNPLEHLSGMHQLIAAPWAEHAKGQLFLCEVSFPAEHFIEGVSLLPQESLRVVLGHPEWLFLDAAQAETLGSICQALVKVFRQSGKNTSDASFSNASLGSFLSADLQYPLLHPPRPQLPGVELCWRYVAERNMGGDFLDCYFNVHFHRLYMAIGDATGSGLQSALISAVTAGTMRTAEFLSRRLDNIATWSLSPDEHLLLIAEAVHNNMRTLASPHKKLLTLCLMSLDIETGELLYLSAGHNPPFLVERRNNRVRRLMALGERMGFNENPVFRIHRERLSPGDFLFACTDGLFETASRSQGDQRFSQRLKALLLESGNMEDIQASVLREAEKYRGGGPAQDDIVTLFAHWRTPHLRCHELTPSVTF